MFYYDKEKKEFINNDSFVVVDHDEFYALYTTNEEAITKGEKAITVDDNRLAIIDLTCKISVNANGSFRFSDDGDYEISVNEKNIILDEQSKGYIHWYDNGIHRALIREDEDFDWDSKTIVKKYNKELNVLKASLYNLDFETIARNIGIRITMSEIGDVYLPVDHETKATIALLYNIPLKQDRSLVVYRLGENNLIKAGPVVLRDVTESTLLQISKKLLSFDYDVKNAVEILVSKITNERDTEKLKNIKDNYARLLLELEEGGE